MNLNAKVHPMTSPDIEARRQGVGANALWNGPYDSTGFPKGKGDSAGKDGIVLSMVTPNHVCGCPITKRAKGIPNVGY